VKSRRESGARSVPIYCIASILRGETEELSKLYPRTKLEVWRFGEPAFVSPASFIFVALYDVINLFLRKNLRKSFEPQKMIGQSDR
jgi:hypothetical protein